MSLLVPEKPDTDTFYAVELEGNTKLQSRGGGVLPEKLGRGVWSASENPYPIYDQNLLFSLPYL